MRDLSGWHNVEELCGYKIEKDEHDNFYGRLTDKNGNTIKFVGMNLDNIGYSMDREQTEMITRKEFDRFIGTRTLQV